MMFVKKFEMKWCVLVLSVVLLLSGQILAAETTQYYKMISAVEYAGNGQFRNQTEMLFSIDKQSLSEDKVQYVLSANNFDKQLSFVIDNKTQHMSATGEDLAFLGKVTNQCAKSLRKVTSDNIGKTWKQSFNLSSLGDSLPSELNFTMTATHVQKDSLGDMIAVRALSEPFFVKTGRTLVNSRINVVYLFDSKIEDIYLSISVFEATVNVNGSKEILRHELVTYKTDEAGQPVDLSDIGADFVKFVGKVGLTGNSLKVQKQAPLPQWARSEALQAAQVANVYAATACEGALNPVATVFVPAAQVMELQAKNELIVADAQLAQGDAATQNVFQKIEANWGWNIETIGVVAGATVGTIAVAGGFSSSSSSRSPN
ncbi:MAG: hypothetical protein KAS75_01560 [Planctomycetes bacterium]|nr:hypothetical protein [Planctomycetota bacterium]